MLPTDELRRRYGADIDRMRADMAAGLAPAEPKALAVALGPFAHFAETAGLLNGTSWADWARLYVENLRDLPGDLVIDAFGEIMRTWRWPRMPLPGDVRAIAEPLRQARADRALLIATLARRIGRT